MRVWACLTGLAAGVLLLTTQASAQGVWPGGPGWTSPLVPGQLFVGFGAQVGTYDLPRFESPYRSFTNTPSLQIHPSFDPDPTVAGPGFTFGYVFENRTFPDWAGEKVRLSFGAQFWEGHDSRRQDVGITGTGFLSLAPIDGSPGSNVGYGIFTTQHNSFDVDVNGYELSMRLTSDMPLSTRVTLSPFVSLFGGQSRESYTARSSITQGSVYGAPYSLDERLSTARVGAMLGTGVTVRVVRRVSLHLGAQAGFVWMRSSLTGSDCFAATIPPLGTPCGAASMPAGSFQTSVSATRSTVGFRGGLMGGATFDLTFAVLSLTGFMTYDSQVPGIRNPVVTTTTIGSNNRPTSGRASIFFDDALNFGGLIVLRFPLSVPGG